MNNDSTAHRTYEAPAVVDLGTVQELTQGFDPALDLDGEGLGGESGS